MSSHSPADDRDGQMQQRLEVGGLLLVAHAQLAVVVHPGMRALDDPTPSASLGFVPALGRGPARHVRDIAPGAHLLVRRPALVALVHAEVLRSILGRLGPSNHDRVQGLGQQLHVVPIGPGDDKRERGATAVHEQTALGSFFFPDPWDCSPPPLAPKALCLGCRPGFAIPRRCLPSRRTRPAPPATGARKTPPAATFGSGDESRWHCRNSWARPSIGSRCATHTRWRRKSRAAKSVCGRRPAAAGIGAGARSADRAAATEVGPATKAHRILPRIGVSAWGNHGRGAEIRQLSFTDKLLVYRLRLHSRLLRLSPEGTNLGRRKTSG